MWRDYNMHVRYGVLCIVCNAQCVVCNIDYRVCSIQFIVLSAQLGVGYMHIFF